VKYNYIPFQHSRDWEEAPQMEERKLVSIFDENDEQDLTQYFLKMKGIEEYLGVPSTISEIEEEIYLEDVE